MGLCYTELDSADHSGFWSLPRFKSHKVHFSNASRVGMKQKKSGRKKKRGETGQNARVRENSEKGYFTRMGAGLGRKKP